MAKNVSVELTPELLDLVKTMCETNVRVLSIMSTKTAPKDVVEKLAETERLSKEMLKIIERAIAESNAPKIN